ncbi:unnamed protein product [Prorocentrum cordatum]|uniref:Uncharacterized protein n=1 Tax=Prorocentrum cordatum TaxID=2364126 RepID=A0ABN9V140_9DINO|nr:unnamed protein product [Polarella glacialis]
MQMRKKKRGGRKDQGKQVERGVAAAPSLTRRKPQIWTVLSPDRALAISEVPISVIQVGGTVGAVSEATTGGLQGDTKLLMVSPSKATARELKHLGLSDLVAARLRSAPDNGRPKRVRIEPVQAWRNERVIYERTEGSQLPNVKAIARNLTHRPGARLHKLGEGKILKMPPLDSGTSFPQTFRGLSTPAMRSQYFNLPMPLAGQTPHPVPLRVGRGILYVLLGAVKICYEGSSDEDVLRQGDIVKFSSPKLLLMTAAAPKDEDGAAGSAAECARLLWVEVNNDAARAPAARTGGRGGPGRPRGGGLRGGGARPWAPARAWRLQRGAAARHSCVRRAVGRRPCGSGRSPRGRPPPHSRPR